MAWEVLHLTNPPMVRDDVLPIQRRALKAFGSYAVPLGVRENSTYDKATSAFVSEFQRRKNATGYKPALRTDGWADWATKKALGVLPGAITPQAPQYVGYAVPGTWGVWNIGPQCMAVNRDPARVQVQGVGYNTSAFLSPDPQHSYIEARNEGTAELLRLALPDPRRKFIAGYSMGADVVARFLAAWPAERRDEIVGVFTFGSPARPAGTDESGSTSANGGISGFYTPEWARSREWSYHIDGDMYSDAAGLMPALYDILTRMEASPEFMMYLFQVLSSSFGPALLGVAGQAVPGFGALSGILGMVTSGPLSSTSGPPNLFAMMLNLPMIITTLIAALKFLFTNAHGKYWVDRIFDGMNAEDHAASVVRRLAV
jgi:hypothetical protein